ncbi:hypothetical protein J2Z83_001607 [Virgibacillus natechei]|uniref:Uncharacterized protein n=1 Tax=Virgibacillus natechei TaxID=1216297 RepID=A0ABS4IF61_9BACI|nr:hypothetical protein [Virgibacillus natechei]
MFLPASVQLKLSKLNGTIISLILSGGGTGPVKLRQPSEHYEV